MNRNNKACRDSCTGSCKAVIFDPLDRLCYKGPVDVDTMIAGEAANWTIGSEPWLFSSFDDSVKWETTTSVRKSHVTCWHITWALV